MNLRREKERAEIRAQVHELLSQLGADTILNTFGQTALMLYTMSLNLAGAQMMLKLGGNPNAIDSIGRTTLHFLCLADHEGQIIPWLTSKNTLQNRFLCVNAQT